ncbi:MAG: class B sortase [Gudongella sp.]|nr:class B sortase [Gudongella sp.]
MNKSNILFKYILWIIIFISLIVLVFAINREYKRNEASKRLYTISILENNEKEDNSIVINEDNTKYSTKTNLQKTWLDINPDYQGWLQIENTNIDYPVVRAIDNYFYLDKDFLKEDSELGAIFMDYRNIGNFNDRHTAIYGHYTWTGKMFGDLHNYKEELFSNENRIIKFNSLFGEKEFEIFSVYVDSAEDYKLKFDFEDDIEYLEYLKSLNELSIHSFESNLDPDKLLLSLATCSYEVSNGRLIVHAIEK